MDSITYFTTIDYFLPIIRIYKLVIFIAGNARLYGLLFVDW